MILSGLEIKKQCEQGRIQITPFEEGNIGPNSYNLRLHKELLVYTDEVLDMKKPLNTCRLEIPETGLILEPGRFYLGRTFERTATDAYVPMLEGRSSIGRLGLSIHVTAGFGDIGFDGYWTLEIHCLKPVRVYPMVPICQVYYHSIQGEVELYKSKKYQHNQDIQPSLLHQDFLEK